MCPCSGKLPNSIFPPKIVCHCLLIESKKGLILVDSGLGKKDLNNPKSLGFISSILGVQKELKLSAIDQIQSLGFSPGDVRHIIPTHLDLDHAGGINDFPNAIVHTSKAEYNSALFPRSIKEKIRYRQANWNKNTKWKVYDESFGEKWFGFNSVREIEGLPSEILLIPLPGHSKGHFGIAIQTKEGWLLHAGDSYFDTNEISFTSTNKKPLIRWNIFQRLVHQNFKNAMKNQQKLIQLKNSENTVKIICSHDLNEYQDSLIT